MAPQSTKTTQTSIQCSQWLKKLTPTNPSLFWQLRLGTLFISDSHVFLWHWDLDSPEHKCCKLTHINISHTTIHSLHPNPTSFYQASFASVRPSPWSDKMENKSFGLCYVWTTAAVQAT